MSRARSVATRWVLAPLAIMAVGAVAVSSASAEPVAGSAGTETALPLTESAVTVQGRGTFSDLAITVNQTESLTNQAVSITWTGGTKTRRGPGQFAAHFLQIFQCWGDPDDWVPENPGPPPEQCVTGASTAKYGGIGSGVVPAGNSTRRVISGVRDPGYDPAIGFTDERTGSVWRPFRAVDGTEVDVHINPDYNPQRGGIYWTNPYFNLVTTNEVNAAVTQSDGTGTELFQVLTGLESTGLGCGQRVQPVADGGVKEPQCWIVVVPRGTPIDENEGSQAGGDRADNFGVFTSPLSENAWKNRIAIPIEFNSLESPCSIADLERRIAGNDLILQAVARWQPALCEGTDLPPYSYAPVPDSTARQLITNPASGSPGLVAIGRPIAPTQVAEGNPVIYAPLTLSGITIGFNVERILTLEAPQDAQDQLTGLRIENLNLTPRLVAKLLTQSYRSAVEINGSKPGYEWLSGQPDYLGLDPDFLQFNPEFELLRIGDRRTFGSLQLPAGNSDAARLVWEWVLADPEAAAWMAGQADEWGMVVNPAYSTDPEVNTAGINFAAPIPQSFPKADSYCYQAPPTGLGNSVVPPPLCGTDWLPYARSLAEAALRARSGFDGAKIALDVFAARPTDAWNRTDPQLVGRRSMLSLTDTPNAALLGLQTANLSRAGDNGPDRQFNAPDSAGLLAGLESMRPGSEPQVLEPALADQTDGAYPLATVTYAAVAPLSLNETARREYAEFIAYATGPGQEPGFEPGELPAGYEPLPTPLREQAALSALTIVELEPEPEPEPEPELEPTTIPPPPTTTVPTTTPPSVAPPVAPPSGGGLPAGSSGGSSSGGASSGGSSSGGSSSGGSSMDTTTVPSTTVSEAGPETTVQTTPPNTAAPTTEVPPDTDTPPTPGDDIGPVRVAVPLLGGLAMASAWGALELTKRSRRATDGPEFDDLSPEVDGET